MKKAVPTIVHVNRHVVIANRRNNRSDGPISVRRGKSGRADRCGYLEGRDAQGNVLVRFYYAPDDPLHCGAVVYCELSPTLTLQLEERIPETSRTPQTCRTKRRLCTQT